MLGFFGYGPQLPAAVPGRFAQSAYVWQRSWTKPLQDAVIEQHTNFAGFVLLHAEVQWVRGQPKVFRVPLDFGLLREAHVQCGLALRVGPYGGPFASNNPVMVQLTELAASLVKEAQTNGVTPTELQIDFDCAESKLAGYREWIMALRRKLAPLPVALTALPTWLKQTAFRELASSADGFVLQVHSLDRPRGIDAPFTLCDPQKARAAVRQAGELGLPFRVALPTYGYVLAFTADGKFVGLSAEGPSLNWPKGTLQRKVNANPAELSQLIAEWSNHPPAHCRGVIWYRLPIAGENLNWPRATLSMVMSGRSPSVSLRLEARRSGALVEVDWVNAGGAVKTGAVAVRARWQQGALLAGDGLHGFVLSESSSNSARFINQSVRLRPDERQQVGWLRFNQETEVELEFER